jgi:hypothetical protein
MFGRKNLVDREAGDFRSAIGVRVGRDDAWKFGATRWYVLQNDDLCCARLLKQVLTNKANPANEKIRQWVKAKQYNL